MRIGGLIPAAHDGATLKQARLRPSPLEVEVPASVLTGGSMCVLAAFQALRRAEACFVIDECCTRKGEFSEMRDLTFTKLRLSDGVTTGQNPDLDRLDVIHAAVKLSQENQMTCSTCQPIALEALTLQRATAW